MLSNILNISLNHLLQFPCDGHVSTHKIQLRFLKLFQYYNKHSNKFSFDKNSKKISFQITFCIYLIKSTFMIK